MRREKRDGGDIQLVSVYRCRKIAADILYRLLLERKPQESISHLEMPSWEKHLAFIDSRPYVAWYLVKRGSDYIGAAYLTDRNEIGVWILGRWRDEQLKPLVIGTLMQRHPRARFYANVNPANKSLALTLREMGFSIVQHTYVLDAKKLKDR